MIDDVAKDAATVVEKHVYFQSGFKHPHPAAKGSIESSVKTRLVRTRNGNVIRIADTAKHAWAQEDGAGPHIIRARRAKALRFIGSGGVVLYRRMVRHPGNRPTHFLLRATYAAGNFEFSALKARGEALAKRF
jgi:hypothetical protein